MKIVKPNCGIGNSYSIQFTQDQALTIPSHVTLAVYITANGANVPLLGICEILCLPSEGKNTADLFLLLEQQ